MVESSLVRLKLIDLVIIAVCKSLTEKISMEKCFCGHCSLLALVLRWFWYCCCCAFAANNLYRVSALFHEELNQSVGLLTWLARATAPQNLAHVCTALHALLQPSSPPSTAVVLAKTLLHGLARLWVVR